jgi:DNA polymerase IIIc chi subunit
MNYKVERSQIIEQLKNVKDIDVIKAIKNILAFASKKEKVFDFIVSEEQKENVRKRVKEYKVNPENVLSFNEIEKKIKFD